jgi:hypothetical protein
MKIELDSYREVRFFVVFGESLPLASKKQTKHAWFLRFFSATPSPRDFFPLSLGLHFFCESDWFVL